MKDKRLYILLILTRISRNWEHGICIAHAEQHPRNREDVFTVDELRDELHSLFGLSAVPLRKDNESVAVLYRLL